MPNTPDRRPGVLEEDEELRLIANPVGPSQPGAMNFDGAAFVMRDAVGNFNPRPSGVGQGQLPTKSGNVAKASFAGKPKKATVTFTTAFASSNYSVAISLVASAGFSPTIESQLAASFVINMQANNINFLTSVHWVAVLNGESV